MRRRILILSFLSISVFSFPQTTAFNNFLHDTAMLHASVSICISEAYSNDVIFSYNPGNSLTPASILKLVTTSAAFELLGADHKFRTIVGYTGVLNKRSGRLSGDIIIKGGGDPALGSKEFAGHYENFIDEWITEIIKAGIKKIDGRILTDDSYYDYQPVPVKWQWEDIGNYYGAGVYGLSVFDNTCEIHFKTSGDSSDYIITGIYPDDCLPAMEQRLTVYGSRDEAYVFCTPYGDAGWIEGSIPANMEDFILKASIPDPPLLIAELVDDKLRKAGVKIKKEAATYRTAKPAVKPVNIITLTDSPQLKDIITILNHESVNLYAEHLVKELGKLFRGSGSTPAGTDVIRQFLDSTIVNDGYFIEDGSGLSRSNAVNSSFMVGLLNYMKIHSKYRNDFVNSLPAPGEGSLEDYFRDDLFTSRLYAKSGSMKRVRSFAGYLKTLNERELTFCIIVNNFNGPSSDIVSHIEKILKETILEN